MFSRGSLAVLRFVFFSLSSRYLYLLIIWSRRLVQDAGPTAPSLRMQDGRRAGGAAKKRLHITCIKYWMRPHGLGQQSRQKKYLAATAANESHAPKIAYFPGTSTQEPQGTRIAGVPATASPLIGQALSVTAEARPIAVSFTAPRESQHQSARLRGRETHSERQRPLFACDQFAAVALAHCDLYAAEAQHG